MHLLFDIGATNTRVALSKNGQKIDEVLVADTPTKFKDGVALVKMLSDALLRSHKAKLAAGGVASALDYRTGKILKFHHPDWTGKNLMLALRKALHCPVMLENDAALGAIGEAHYGAAKGRHIVAYLTISSGIGGARVVDGQLDHNAAGFEPKLQMLQRNPFKNFGSLSSGIAIQAIYKKPGEKLADKSAWKEIEIWLTMGFNNAIVMWSPEILIINGPVAFNRHISFTRIQKALKKNLRQLKPQPKIIKSQLKDLAGLYGALALARQE